MQRPGPAQELHYPDAWDESKPLRDVPPLPPEPDWDEHDHRVLRLPYRPRPLGRLAPGSDGALQARGPVLPLAATAGVSFDGVGVGLPGFSVTSAPPDTNGAVGTTQYVQWVNTSFAVFDKTGAVVYGPAAGKSLWSGFGGDCEARNDGDPIVLFDKAASRWVMTQFSVRSGNFLQCVAVSTTADATGSYRRFAYSFPNFNDYPKVGVWPDGYYFSFNMFNAAGTAFLGGRACVLDRLRLITAADAPGPMQCFQLTSTFGGLLPSDLDGATPPPAGAPNDFLAFDDVNRDGLNLWKFHVDWQSPSLSTFTGPTKIAGAAFTEACSGGTCIPQPGTTQKLDSLADRLMYRLAYRNFGAYESLVVNHSVNAGGSVSGVRWYEIRGVSGTRSVFQQGTYSPDTDYRWMGSIAQDRDGNMLVGYSRSNSTSVRPSAHYTGRLATDPAGTMQAETAIQVGVGSQTSGLSRWGDYSATTVDPTDDCTFWFTTEYLKSSGSFNWSTRVASFKFPSCGSATADFSLAVSPSSQAVTAGATAGYTVDITRTGGFAGAITLSASGLPAGASASFNPNPASGSSSALSIATGSTTGTFTFTVTGQSGSLTHTATATLVVNPPPTPDFGIAASPGSVSIAPGGSGTSTVTVNSINGFNSAVSLSATGLPSGVTATFFPTPVTPVPNGSASSTLTFAATAGATPGASTVTVTGTSGSIVRSTTLSLIITSPGPVTLFYDGAESASTTLTFSNTTTSTRWTRNSTAPFAGSWRWKAGGATGGNYGNKGDARMTTPVLNLSGASTATLTYAFKHSTQANFDFFEVRISTDGGTTWTNLARTSGNSQNWSGWAPLATVNLNAYAGQTSVRIQFRLTTDVSGTAFGAAVDEIKVVKQ